MREWVCRASATILDLTVDGSRTALKNRWNCTLSKNGNQLFHIGQMPISFCAALSLKLNNQIRLTNTELGLLLLLKFS